MNSGNTDEATVNVQRETIDLLVAGCSMVTATEHPKRRTIISPVYAMKYMNGGKNDRHCKTYKLITSILTK